MFPPAMEVVVVSDRPTRIPEGQGPSIGWACCDCACLVHPDGWEKHVAWHEILGGANAGSDGSAAGGK
jgi:hypothetical protein